MLGHTKTLHTEIKIKEGNRYRLYKVPGPVAKRIVSSLSRYKEEEKAIPWRDALKEDIEAGGGNSTYFIRGAREAAGMTQTELAEELGIQRTNLSNIERGKRPVGKDLARKFGKIFKVDYRVFL